jgi:arylsulfatase
LRSIAPVAIVVVLASCAGGAPEPPRNVIFIVIDAFRADHMGALGYGRGTTPNLDEFASRGLLFTRAYSAASWTLPSLASYMTSVYPAVHGVRRPPNAPDHLALPREFLTLAESLRANGLRTASITSQPWMSKAMGLVQGFDEARAVSHASAPGEAGILTKELIAWLRQNRESPFFLYAHFMGPHSPYDVPSEFTGRYTGGRPVPETVAEFHRLYEFESEAVAYQEIVDRAREGGLVPADVEYMRDEYDEKLAYTDARVGELLDELETLGLLDDSIVLVTADHGEAFYEHGTIFHGQHIHEELVRVPLIIHLPGELAKPARIDEVVELIDLYPTIHELLGIPVPVAIQGRSLIPVLEGGAGDGVAFAEGHGFKVVTGGWSSYYFYNDSLNTTAGIEVEELYDLRCDPFELVDLSDEEPAAVERHRELAFEIWREILDLRYGGAYQNPAAEFDEEQIEKLRSIGYLGG